MLACEFKSSAIRLQPPHHHAAFKSRHQNRRDCSRIDIFSDFAGIDPFLQQLLQPVDSSLQGSAHMRSEYGVSIVGIDSGIQQWASTRRDGRTLCKILDHVSQLGEWRGTSLNGAQAVLSYGGPGVIECSDRQLFLAGEVPIDAAFFKAGLLHQIGQAGAFVSPLIEDRGGFLDDALPRSLTLADRGAHQNSIAFL